MPDPTTFGLGRPSFAGGHIGCGVRCRRNVGRGRCYLTVFTLHLFRFQSRTLRNCLHTCSSIPMASTPGVENLERTLELHVWLALE
jgi:hypothetical protein